MAESLTILEGKCARSTVIANWPCFYSYSVALCGGIVSREAQAQTAPAPAPPGPVNITAILEKGGQFTTLIRLLNTNQIINQLETQLNSSNQGLTIFAPTDNAFTNLKPGTLNNLSTQQQVALLLYHVLPKYYNLASFESVSNPVRTQAGGMDGGEYGLNFTSLGNNQVNVSTGVVETQLNNALRQEFPLAVYPVDRVLLPSDLFGAKSPKSAPSPSGSPVSDTNTTPATKPGPKAPSAPSKDSSSAYGKSSVGVALVVGVALMCSSFLS
ncbi:hypothetical protein Syun_008574 [Stephania yunnanensis]|uniref:FAS1 domain-containing protein n=1 Tax=Stephania yunnanensis TaxID=152371 RepID=A0AAP0PQ52_9MAGN